MPGLDPGIHLTMKSGREPGLLSLGLNIPTTLSSVATLPKIVSHGQLGAMDKRYQIFVSSTFADLQQERQAVMQALLSLDHFPAGMELFPASDEDQWALIKGVIDDSDYYVLVIGGRYGSTADDGISYTEMEFEYAKATKKPILAFIHQNELLPV